MPAEGWKNKKLLISLYDGCQYRCEFCVYGYAKDKEPLSDQETMSTEDWCALFAAAYAQGYRDLEIGGRGEPTLYPSFVQVVSRAHDIGFNIDLLTNGLNDKAVIEVLPFIRQLKINLNGIDEVQLNKIHVPPPGFTFERCMASIKNIISTIVNNNFNIRIRTNYVVTTHSWKEAFTFPERINSLLADALGERKLYIIFLHFHNYVKTPAEYLGFDDKGLNNILLLAMAGRRRPFLLENTNILEFIQKTEVLIERLRPLSENNSDSRRHACYTCEQYKRILFIDGNGDCYGCYNPFRTVNGLSKTEDPFFFGNVRAQRFEEIFCPAEGFNPKMDVTQIYWRPCLFCHAKGPVSA